MGALNVGAGVETQVLNLSFLTGPSSEIFVTNYFVGAEYELADGLLIGLGIGNLDGDNVYNGDYRAGTSVRPRTWNATATARVEF